MNLGEVVLINVGVADVHAEPDAASERVTQSLLGRPGLVLARQPGWLRLAFDDYAGWVAEPLLTPGRSRIDQPRPAADRAGTTEPDRLSAPPWPSMTALVTAPRAALDVVDGATLSVFAGTELAALEVDGSSYRVRLPDGRAGRLAAADAAMAPIARLDARALPAIACRFLDAPYRWGGTTVAGLDCSGFVQLVYRLAGYRLPRDAEPQRRALASLVPLDAVHTGDLLFFGPAGKATHVALALDARRYIHAAGAVGRVLVSSLDAGSPDYDARHVPLLLDARRVVGVETAGVASSEQVFLS